MSQRQWGATAHVMRPASPPLAAAALFLSKAAKSKRGGDAADVGILHVSDGSVMLTQTNFPFRFCDVHIGRGPVLATAIHAGHELRPELLPYMSADDSTRRRDEDPLTDIFAATADHYVLARHSRFEVDLNRTRERALCFDPKDTWGLQFWKDPAPIDMVERSLQLHDAFYALMSKTIETLVGEYGQLLVLDVHSYNHRREEKDEALSTLKGNPDIDLGITELDWSVWGDRVDRFADALREAPYGETHPSVGYNIRYPDGGNFPEWVNATFDARVGVITLEYKKSFMDEWTGQADLTLVEDLRSGLAGAIDRVRPMIQKDAA